MAEKLNTIVIMCDQMKATASHLYGNAFCETPAVARLADEGIRYQHAITPHPLCVPARISLWTSQFPHSHGGRRNETWMPAGVTHAFKIWKEAGYHTGLIGKNHCFDHVDDLALFDTWCQISHTGRTYGERTKGMEWFRSPDSIDAAHDVRREMPPCNPRFSYATTDFFLEDYSSGLIAGQTVRFLEEHKEEPFALWVSFPDPHEPWEAPARFAEMFPHNQVEIPPWRDDEFSDGTAPERNRVLYEMLGVRDDSEEDLLNCIGIYHAMIRFMDDGVGQILDTVDRLGLRQKTAIVFCSDHGDFMGEHAMQCKGGAFYDCLTRVPLVLSCPGRVPEGVVDESMTNLIDVVPTLLALQGIDAPRSMHGKALPGATDAEPRDAAFSEYGAGGPPFRMADIERLEKPWGRKTLIDSLRWREAEGRRKMVRTVDWKFVHDPMGDSDELYDLANDPWELNNDVDASENAGVVAEMRLRLADWSVETEDSIPVPLP